MGDLSIVHTIRDREDVNGNSCYHDNVSGHLLSWNASTMAEYTGQYTLFSGLSCIGTLENDNDIMEGVQFTETIHERTDTSQNKSNVTIDLTVDDPDDVDTDGPTDTISPDRIYTQDEDGDTILHTAILSKLPDVAIECINLATFADQLSIKNRLHQSPLHLAVLTDQPDIARRLVVGGADITARYKHCSPLLMACERSTPDIVQALLEPVKYNETVNFTYRPPYQQIPQNLQERDFNGLTALHKAATNGSIEIVKLLLKKGADVNSREGKTGRTVLHNGCINGDVELVKTLIQRDDCDVNAKTMDNYTPFDLARLRKQNEIQILLAKIGAETEYEDE